MAAKILYKSKLKTNTSARKSTLTLVTCQVSAFQVKYQLRKCMLKIEKFTDVCMTGGMHYTPSHTNVCKFYNFQLTFSQLIFTWNVETWQVY